MLRIAITVCSDIRVAQLFARLCSRTQLAEIATSRSQSLRPLYDQLLDRVPAAPEPAQPRTQPTVHAEAGVDPATDLLRQSTPSLRVPTLRSQAGNALLRASMSAAVPRSGTIMAATPGVAQHHIVPPSASASPLAADAGSCTPNSAYTPDVAFVREQRLTTSCALPSSTHLAATAPARTDCAGASAHARAPAGMPDLTPSMLFSAPPLTPSSKVRARLASCIRA